MQGWASARKGLRHEYRNRRASVSDRERTANIMKDERVLSVEIPRELAVELNLVEMK